MTLKLKKTKIVGVFLLCMANIFGQEKKTYNVAIVIYEGVELFDFAGPGEVFAAAKNTDVADFNVFTVAPTKETITSQTFLSINPNYSINDAPKIDILLIPGGNTNSLLNDENFMKWTNQIYPKLQNFISVCKGVFIPAKLGLLNNLKATTHYSAVSGLRNGYSKINVIEEEKFIDNGKIITAGGVSSGVEGSLHMVRRIAGISAAKQVARYMMYDNWNKDLDLLAYENKIIKKLKNIASFQPSEKKIEYDDDAFDKELNLIKSESIDYGEIEAFALELFNSDKLELSLKVFQKMAKLFPWAASPYQGIRSINDIKKIKSPPTQKEFFAIIKDEGIECANEIFNYWKESYPDWKIFKEKTMNYLGYRYISAKKEKIALEIFKMNTKAYPNSWNVWDSLADIYMNNGDKSNAIKYYKKSLELNPNNDNGKKILLKLKQSSS